MPDADHAKVRLTLAPPPRVNNIIIVAHQCLHISLIAFGTNRVYIQKPTAIG